MHRNRQLLQMNIERHININAAGVRKNRPLDKYSISERSFRISIIKEQYLPGYPFYLRN